MAPEIGFWDVVLRLVVAAVLTGAIGLERELRERSAGLRTHMLVGVGSALFTLVSAYAWGDFLFRGSVRLDPTRIAAQIVTGIGFLGAGAILRQGLSVRGLTTAAGLWVVAAIGMASAAGYWSAALVGTAIALIGLGPFKRMEAMFNRLGGNRGVLEVRLGSQRLVGDVLEALEPVAAEIGGVELETLDDQRWARIDLVLRGGGSEQDALRLVSAIDGVTEVRWTG
jgi:putative Mg2+ transporter-C (MgtC) family protein